MLEKVFSIDKFNIIEDSKNYYFLRALNNADHNDIKKGYTLDENRILKIRTDRERFEGTPRYNEDSILSLEEIFNHIKMHHSYDTNCISLTTNANVACLYGRGFYNDEYVLVCVPKNEIGSTIVNAGLYMLDEINKRIKEIINHNKLDIRTLQILRRIEHSESEGELEYILQHFNLQKDSNTFEKGIIFSNTNSIDYPSLNAIQNLEKNKIIAKLDIIGIDIIPNVSNKFLIQTIGNAFSSLEFIHYQSINGEKIIKVDSDIVDILSIIQQLPENELSKELKKDILEYINSSEFNLINNLDNKLIDEEEYTIENMYELTNGKLDYYSALNMCKKSFYLAKSRLRTLKVVEQLRIITNNDLKYQGLFEYILENTYGVEPEIFSKSYRNKLRVSESVSLDFNLKEIELFSYVSKLNEKDLNYIVNNPKKAFEYILTNYINIEHSTYDKNEYYANAIFDSFNWKKLNIVAFSDRQRNQIINELKKYDLLKIYEYLKSQNIKESDISNILLTNIIKSKTLETIDLKETFTLEALENFVGYYKINKTKGLKLRSYQASTLQNIDKKLNKKQFTAAVLPTGAGKSFVALAKMLEYSSENILYLAPNDLILKQIEEYIVNIICEEEFVTKDELIENNINPNNKTSQTRYIIGKKFPNLKLVTYQKLLEDRRARVSDISEEQIINKKYSLIIFDELHRTGASEWEMAVLEMLSYQDSSTKVLGITATPTRDVDNRDMAEEWARYFGYSEEEIIKQEHFSIKMEIEDAIKAGYIINPKIVECEYTISQDGTLEKIKEQIDSLDENIPRRIKVLDKFDKLRRKIENASGIHKVIGDNIKEGGKYIVFCPSVNKNKELEKEKIYSKEVITKYKKEIIINIMRYNNYDEKTILSLQEKDSIKEYDKYAAELNVEFESLLGEYSDSVNQRELEKFKKENGKTKFIIVIDKLNEGVHIPSVNGMIWFRPLDENTKILYLQQLGRVINSKEPNKKIETDKIPVVIDVANNCFRVNMNKNKNKKENIASNDINKLIVIKEWVLRNNNRVPNLNSNDKTESSYGITLKKIQNTYSRYYENINLLKELNDERKKIEIEKILKLGIDIDLWNYPFPEKTNEVNQKSDSNYSNIIDYEEFKISGILRELYDFSQEIEELSDELWMEKYNIAKKYYQQFGTLKMPKRTKVLISDGILEIVDEKDQRYKQKNIGIINLGMWIQNQKQRKEEISQDRKKLLEEIGMVWENVLDIEWMEKYNIAKMYYEQFGNLEISARTKVLINNGNLEIIDKKDPRYIEKNIGIINLGMWIQNQKQRKEEISQERKRLLGEIGMTWKGVFDIEWMEKYNIAKMYYEKFGNLEISVSTKVLINNGTLEIIDKKDPRYKEENIDIINLGRWMFAQKENKNKISPERKKLLDEIGMIWDNVLDNEWMEKYIIAKIYYEKFGNLEISARTKVLINNGNLEIIDEKDARYKQENTDIINLGSWVQTQRKAKMSTERKKLLDEIGMIWSNIFDVEWNKKYNIAKMYYEKYGNLKIPSAAKVLISNGNLEIIDKKDPRYKEENIDIINLGDWIQKQRQRKNKISLERKKILEEIGIVLETKKDQTELTDLCIQYGIDIKKNKSILNKSYQEMYCKISFLIENNIDLLNENGELHEIFFMSDENMKNKYCISLCELLNKYINKNKRGMYICS